MGGGGEKLEEVEGGETVIGIYCMRKESISNKRETFQSSTHGHLAMLSQLLGSWSSCL